MGVEALAAQVVLASRPSKTQTRAGVSIVGGIRDVARVGAAHLISAPADKAVHDNFRKTDYDIFQHPVLPLACLDCEFHRHPIVSPRRPECG